MMSGLEEVNFSGTDLTHIQLTGLFTQLSVSEDHNLRTLDLSKNDLRCVSTELLVKGMMSGLEEVNFNNNTMTPLQLAGICTMVAYRITGRLRKIILDYVYRDDCVDPSIPPNLLQRARLNKSVMISYDNTNYYD